MLELGLVVWEKGDADRKSVMLTQNFALNFELEVLV